MDIILISKFDGGFEPEKYHFDNENTFPDEYDEGLIDFGVDFDIVGTTSLCPSRRNTAFLWASPLIGLFEMWIRHWDIELKVKVN